MRRYKPLRQALVAHLLMPTRREVKMKPGEMIELLRVALEAGSIKHWSPSMQQHLKCAVRDYDRFGVIHEGYISAVRIAVGYLAKDAVNMLSKDVSRE